ncbi:hypothetical protein [Mariniblastus fucicola]|uniref:hypothetical protein n=1 Tax=Mariniblastus fucicola TaxID=980251 RepID=UPI0011DFAAA2|nr:hypothetical protein [Mariniblastus fucicola]
MLLFTIGCGSSDTEITAKNNSGQTLENVSALANGKSFTFGVLIDGGEKGYMTAERTFGGTFPLTMTMQFENLDGESFQREINFKNKPTRKLTVTIDEGLNALGTFE